MNILLILAICFIIFAYIKLYLRPKKDIQLLQANLSNFDSNLLVEKQPILIFDKVVHPQNVIDVFFKYMYHLSNSSHTASESDVQNLSRFAVIYNNRDKAIEISIKKYFTKADSISKNMYYSSIDLREDDVKPLTIKLPEKNILIIPYLFSFKTEHTIPVTYLSDFIHVLF